MSLSNILLIPGIGQMSFRDALSILSPYSPRLAYNFLDPTNSLFQGTTLTPVTAVTNPVGVVIDQTQGGLGNLGAELQSTGAIGLAGTATAAAYNTTTGIGSCTRVDVSNQSYVEFSGLASGFYRVQITNTGAVELRVRSGGFGGALVANIAAGQTVTAIGPSATNSITITTAAVAGTATFTVSSLRYVPGNHATASSDAKRPLWNSFTVNNRTVRGAVFDGSDDCLQVSGFDLSNTDEVCVIAGVRKLSDAASGIVVEHSTNVANPGTLALLAPSDSGNNSYRFASTGSTTTTNAGTGIFAAAPDTAHLVGIGDISAPLTRLRRNGSVVASSTSSQGSGNYTNSTLNIGMRAGTSLPFNGAISYLFICGAIPPDDVLTRIYRGLAPQIGVAV